jgi:hypothetical protein
MVADHLSTMRNCEGMRRFFTVIAGVDVHDQTLSDEQVAINHYVTSIHAGICTVCFEPGARFDNPTCLTCHGLCSNCVGLVQSRCPTCRRKFYIRLRLIQPDASRKCI